MDIQWGLAQGPNAFEANFQRGLQIGDYQRQRREETEQRNALAAYVTNPNEQSLNALAPFNPQFVMQERARMQQAAQEQATRKVTVGAAQGDADAILQLWGLDPQMALRLDTREREQAAQGLTYLSQAGLAIDGLPEEQRAAAWDDAINRGVQMGYDDLADFRGQYSPQALQAVVARAGQMGDLLGNRRPRYMAIPEGGTLVNTGDVQAVQQFSQSQFPNAPQIGAVEDGYRYRGGNPADPASWEQVGQQMSAPQMTVSPRELDALVRRFGPEEVQRRINSGQVVVGSN